MVNRNDLYGILGVDKSASKDSVKRAYRKRAKKAHPDTGGNVEKFGALKRAHDILTDDARRAKYDTTGDVDEKTPDNDQSNAINTLAMAFAVVLQKCAQDGRSPLEKDMVQAIKHELNRVVDENQKQIRILRTVIQFDKKMVGRFKSNKPDNIFESIISQRLTAVGENIGNAERNVKSAQDALALLEDYSYRKDEAAYESPGDAMMRRVSRLPSGSSPWDVFS